MNTYAVGKSGRSEQKNAESVRGGESPPPRLSPHFYTSSLQMQKAQIQSPSCQLHPHPRGPPQPIAASPPLPLFSSLRPPPRSASERAANLQKRRGGERGREAAVAAAGEETAQATRTRSSGGRKERGQIPLTDREEPKKEPRGFSLSRHIPDLEREAE